MYAHILLSDQKPAKATNVSAALTKNSSVRTINTQNTNADRINRIFIHISL